MFFLLFVFQPEQDGLWEASKGTGQEVCPHIECRSGLYPAWIAWTEVDKEHEKAPEGPLQ